MLKSGVAAAAVGLIYGGLPAARHARLRYIQNSQAEMYTSRVDAVVGEGRRHGAFHHARVLKTLLSFYTWGICWNCNFCFLCGLNQRSAHNAAIRGFVRYGWRWSWRVGAFVTLFK